VLFTKICRIYLPHTLYPLTSIHSFNQADVMLLIFNYNCFDYLKQSGYKIAKK